jgi:hypothetical protein
MTGQCPCGCGCQGGCYRDDHFPGVGKMVGEVHPSNSTGLKEASNTSAPRLSGLQRILRMYGSTQVNDVTWFWDYANERPVLAADMLKGSAGWKASEKAKWEMIAKEEAEDARQ